MTDETPSLLPSEALMLAVTQGRHDAVREALDRGADANFTRSGNSPALLAISRKDREMLEILLEGGADANALNANEWSLMHEAASQGLVEVFPMLAEQMFFFDVRDVLGRSPLFVAVEADQLDAVGQLIEMGMSVNKADKEGITPLMIAIDQRNAPMVARLLEAPEVDIHAVDAAQHSVEARLKNWPEGYAQFGKAFKPVAPVVEATEDAPAASAAPKVKLSSIRKR